MADSIKIIQAAERRVHLALGHNTRVFGKISAVSIVLASQSIMSAIGTAHTRETQRDILVEIFNLAGDLLAISQRDL